MYLNPTLKSVLRDYSMTQRDVLPRNVDLVVVLRRYVGVEVCTGDRYRYRSELPFLPVIEIYSEVAANQYSGTHQRVDAD